MNERDKELMKQAETECGFNPDKFADLIRADEREKVIAEFVEAGVLGYDGAVVQAIQARRAHDR